MRKALIVEDAPDSAEGFKKILSGMGFECVVDPIGDMAIKYLSSGEFDIAIMDIVLKTKMTGSDIIHAARELGVKTPIIGVSENRGPADRANDLRAWQLAEVCRQVSDAQFDELRDVTQARPTKGVRHANLPP